MIVESTARHRAAERMSEVLEVLEEAVTVRDVHGELVHANAAALRLIQGAHWTQIPYVDEAGRPVPESARPYAVVRDTGEPVRGLVVGRRTEDGGVQWLLTHAQPLFDEAGELEFVVTSFSDITVQRLAEAALLRDALYDPLTGLANRRKLEADLAEALDDARRAATIFIDLDGFKIVNDTLGHAVGDQVLRIVAERLEHIVRTGDVVARVGGDEFVVCCAGVTDTGLRRLVDRIRLALEAPVRCALADGSLALVPIGASVGWSIAAVEDTPATLLHRADEAMYAAKRARGLDRSCHDEMTRVGGGPSTPAMSH